MSIWIFPTSDIDNNNKNKSQKRGNLGFTSEMKTATNDCNPQLIFGFKVPWNLEYRLNNSGFNLFFLDSHAFIPGSDKRFFDSCIQIFLIITPSPTSSFTFLRIIIKKKKKSVAKVQFVWGIYMVYSQVIYLISALGKNRIWGKLLNRSMRFLLASSPSSFFFFFNFIKHNSWISKKKPFFFSSLH